MDTNSFKEKGIMDYIEEQLDCGVQMLDCGCYTELVNGKHIIFLCDCHEEEYQVMLTSPTHYKKTKMREGREI